jgi:hypothetical protein
MKDMKIEYRDGKLVEFTMDGIEFSSVTSLSFNHEVGETLPSVSITLPIGAGKTLMPANFSRENLQIIEK